jgi:pimeloyl-ACP methyl ester carboxylesterase
MKHHTITGGGGTLLHVVEAGNPAGQPILFIHGFSQCSLVWERQLSSSTLRRHRLVTMDMRGHGSSERPIEGYDDGRRWADDVEATIRELSLDQPILCGWSYGPLVILDYIRHYGEAGIGGIRIVGGITKLGSTEALSLLSPEVLSLVPGLFSREAEPSISSLESLVRLFFVRDRSTAELYTIFANDRQRRRLAVNPYTGADHAWQGGCGREAGRGRAAPRAAFARAHSGHVERGACGVRRRSGHVQSTSCRILRGGENGATRFAIARG